MDNHLRTGIQGFDFVFIGLRMETDAAFCCAACGGVLYAVAGEYFYMAVIHLLTITFVFPTKRRCEHECRAEEQAAEDPMQDDSSHQGQP